MILSRNWNALRQAGMSSGIDVFFIIRIFVFGVYILVGFMCVFHSYTPYPIDVSLSSITIIMIWSPKSVLPDMFAASGEPPS